MCFVGHVESQKDSTPGLISVPKSVCLVTIIASLQGNVDLGITGEDIIQESTGDVNVVMPLGIGKCRLSLQVDTHTHNTLLSPTLRNALLG